MAIFTWKLSFNCISLIFKSEKVGLQPCRTFQLSLSFPVFAVCKMFVRDSKAEQNKPHEIPDSVFGLFQCKNFSSSWICAASSCSSARQVPSHTDAFSHSCSSPGSCQDNTKAERQLRVFFTHSSEQYLIYCPKKPAGIAGLWSPFPASQGEGCWSVSHILPNTISQISWNTTVVCAVFAQQHLRFGLMTIGCFGWGVVSF